jgi:hypothetical protein
VNLGQSGRTPGDFPEHFRVLAGPSGSTVIAQASEEATYFSAHHLSSPRVPRDYRDDPDRRGYVYVIEYDDRPQ